MKQWMQVILQPLRKHSKPTPPAVARVIPGPDGAELLAWEEALPSLILEPPLSLELVGEAEAQWLQVRAPSEQALEHAQQMLQSFWPSCQFERLGPEEDPLTLAARAASAETEAETEAQISSGIQLRVRGRRDLWLWPTSGPERLFRLVRTGGSPGSGSSASASASSGLLARSPGGDPLGQVLAALACPPGQRLVLQLLIRPAPALATARIRRRLEQLLIKQRVSLQQASREEGLPRGTLALRLGPLGSLGLVVGLLLLSWSGLRLMPAAAPINWLQLLHRVLISWSRAGGAQGPGWMVPGLDWGLVVGLICLCLLLLLVWLWRKHRRLGLDQDFLWQDSGAFHQRAFWAQLRVIICSKRPRKNTTPLQEGHPHPAQGPALLEDRSWHHHLHLTGSFGVAPREHLTRFIPATIQRVRTRWQEQWLIRQHQHHVTLYNPPTTPRGRPRWQEQWLIRQQQHEVTLRLLAALRRLEGEVSARWQARRLSQRAVTQILHGGLWGTRWPHAWLPWRWDLLPARIVALLWHLPMSPLSPGTWPLLVRKPERVLPLAPALLEEMAAERARASPHAVSQIHSEAGARAGLPQNQPVDWPALPEPASEPGPSLALARTPGAGPGRNAWRPFTWTPALAGHCLVVGRTGEGKSTVLLGLALEAARQGMGVLVIDPHDLVERLLPLIPPERAEDVLAIDFGEPDKPGFNPLDARWFQQRDKVIADLIASLRAQWAGAWGPRMEAACEATLKLLYSVNEQLVAEGKADQQLTLLEVLPVLTNEAVRRRLLRWLRQPDPLLVRWWQEYFEPLTPWMQLERIDPVLTKFEKFEAIPARQVLGQSCSALDLARWLQEGRLVLLRLAPQVIGEDAARLLGQCFLNLLSHWAQAQPFAHPVLVIVDEFQWFPGVRWSLLLGELRKFGVRFAVATQSLESLRLRPDSAPASQSGPRSLPLLDQLLVNVQTLVAFATSAADAALLARELDVHVRPEDLLQLPRHTCYARLPTQAGRVTCTCRVLPPSVALISQGQQQAERIRTRCRQLGLGRAGSDIEQHLLFRQSWLLHPWAEPSLAQAPAAPGELADEHNGSERAECAEAGHEVLPPKKYRGRRAEARREQAALTAKWAPSPTRAPLPSPSPAARARTRTRQGVPAPAPTPAARLASSASSRGLPPNQDKRQLDEPQSTPLLMTFFEHAGEDGDGFRAASGSSEAEAGSPAPAPAPARKQEQEQGWSGLNPEGDRPAGTGTGGHLPC